MRAPDASARKILLIGGVDRAFLDAEAVSKLPCEVYANMADGAGAAAKNGFAVIAVVLTGPPAELISALKTLRQVAGNARIVLMAQMPQEPLALKLVDSAPAGTNLADDYLICPVAVSDFYQAVMAPPGPSTVGTAAPVQVSATEQKRTEQLEKLATEDDLTGLKNRRYTWEFARQIIDRAPKDSGRVTLLLFDIDNLKSYNDVYGHLAGDQILREAAILMRRCCRSHDMVGRIGGDEFAVVFWDGPVAKRSRAETERRAAAAEHPKEAISVAKRFRNELKKAELDFLGPKGKGILTISGGLASLPRDGSTVQQLFEQADRALLEAKRSGKNKIYLVGKPSSDIADIP
ncbi:MAG: GGDEF domain-containing protein [Planctomycetota bacterium]|jgi:diguanylate cyclase (GGDEF)-like protein